MRKHIMCCVWNDLEERLREVVVVVEVEQKNDKHTYR